MSLQEVLPYLGPIASGLLGGVLVAVINWWVSRARTIAEIDKLRLEVRRGQAELAERLPVEVEKIKAEAVKFREEGAKFALENHRTREQMASTQAALQEVSSHFFKDQDYAIYDGSAGMDLSHFRVVESGFFGDPPNAPTGRGILRIIDTALSLTRSNTKGRYRLILTQYRYDGNILDHLPKNPILAGDRKIRVRFDAKVTDGRHILALSLKYGPGGGHEERIYETVAEKQWESFEVVLRSDPNKQASLYIDDQDVSAAGSGIQIRNLIVSEVRPAGGASS